jgi:hypothetical protein
MTMDNINNALKKDTKYTIMNFGMIGMKENLLKLCYGSVLSPERLQNYIATESRYSTFDRELLAAHAAIKHFRHFCKGRAFQRWTDHKPLVTAISHVSAPFHPDNSTIWHSFQNLMCKCCICPV